MDAARLMVGLRVRVVRLKGTTGMIVNEQHLNNRMMGARGELTGPVPGHGGDVWFVKHDDGVVAVYCFTEIEAV